MVQTLNSVPLSICAPICECLHVGVCPLVLLSLFVKGNVCIITPVRRSVFDAANVCLHMHTRARMYCTVDGV